MDDCMPAFKMDLLLFIKTDFLPEIKNEFDNQWNHFIKWSIYIDLLNTQHFVYVIDWLIRQTIHLIFL